MDAQLACRAALFSWRGTAVLLEETVAHSLAAIRTPAFPGAAAGSGR